MKIGQISVINLKVHCIVGLLPFERIHTQDLFIDIVGEADFEAEALSDQLKSVPSYVDLADTIQNFVIEGQFELLETIAVRGTALLLKTYAGLLSIQITIRKPAAIPAANFACISFKQNRVDF
jgi:dihydroneopterin aldolase